MTSGDTGSVLKQWRVPMVARAADEVGRVSTPLELLFDLTFVVAVSQAAAELGHAVAAGHIGDGINGYLQVFFAIWWAWMNFTWFASAYDTDDVPYRLITAVQMGGVLVLAAGVPSAFEHGEFGRITVGYVIMRSAMVCQWLRAARSDRERRAVALRYAVGIGVVQLLWVARLAVPHDYPTWTFATLAVCEMLVPIWAEQGRPNRTSWHPHHIAERYGLFTIIVLGECVLAATVAIQSSLQSDGVSLRLVLAGFGALALLFGLWWLYFQSPTGHRLSDKPEVAFFWGYGHYFVFASLAALGAGLEVSAEALENHLEISEAGVGYSVAIPVAIYLLMLQILHGSLLSGFSISPPVLFGAVVVILLVPLAVHALSVGGVIVVIAAIVASLVAVSVITDSRRSVSAELDSP
ncbi:low temperature requirement protein A [Jatrophihabitans sp. DSM 45814]